MHPRIEEVLAYLDEQHAALRDAVDSVPAERRSESPAPNQWSTTGIIEHLAIVETSIGSLIQQRVAGARAAGIGHETETSSVLSTFESRPRILDRSHRIVALERAHPTNTMSPEQAWSTLESAHHGLRSTVAAADGLALGEIVHPHPVFGPLNLYHWVAFVAGHEARHAQQIREVAQAIGPGL